MPLSLMLDLLCINNVPSTKQEVEMDFLHGVLALGVAWLWLEILQTEARLNALQAALNKMAGQP